MEKALTGVDVILGNNDAKTDTKITIDATIIKSQGFVFIG